MNEQYTPTTEDVMRGFVALPYRVEPQREDEDFAAFLGRTSIETHQASMASEAAARRWLAAHDAEAVAADRASQAEWQAERDAVLAEVYTILKDSLPETRTGTSPVEKAYALERRHPVLEELAYLRVLKHWRPRIRYIKGYFVAGDEYERRRGRAGVRSQTRSRASRWAAGRCRAPVATAGVGAQSPAVPSLCRRVRGGR